MNLISVLVFYSEEKEKTSPPKEAVPEVIFSQKGTKLSSRILKAKYELLNFPFGKEFASRSGNRSAVSHRAYELDLRHQETETITELSPLEFDPILVPPPVKLKTECCEKYLKGKRCGRCPCFDLPGGPASRMN